MKYPQISPKAARVNANLSQRDAAVKLGISRSSLQNYEDGTRFPTWDIVKKMELVYNFPADFIFFARDSA